MAEPPQVTKMVVDEGKAVDSPMEAQVERMAAKVWSKLSLGSYKVFHSCMFRSKHV